MHPANGALVPWCSLLTDPWCRYQAGNYSCHPDNLHPATISLHVLSKVSRGSQQYTVNANIKLLCNTIY